MFYQLFYNYFLLSLIVNDLQMFFSPFFYFPPFLFYFTFPNSQSSILNSQKAGVFLSFRAGFSAKDAGFFSFYAYLSKSNKRESISILAGFTFDSRLVCFIIMIDLLKNVQKTEKLLRNKLQMNKLNKFLYLCPPSKSLINHLQLI